METIERIPYISVISLALLLGLMSACGEGESTLSKAPSESLVTVEQGIGECNILEAPIYRGAPVTMNTRSHGGGYSPAFEEFWYPQWSGTSVHRYDKDYNYLGYFNTGRNHVMQLWGLPGGDYLTAHWDLESVSRWQARSATEVWTTSLGTIIGGVAADDDFVYAMPHVGNTLWKLDKDSGEVIEQVAVPEQVGTLYGGLAVVGDTLFIGRAHGLVYRVDLDTLELIDTFETQINIYNMSFDGTDYCISPNTDSMFCYAICNDPLVPKAASQHISLQANEDADVTLGWLRRQQPRSDLRDRHPARPRQPLGHRAKPQLRADRRVCRL